MDKNIDPVTLEIVRNALPAISNEMSYALQRTSYNMMIYEVRDYCCSILDSEGNLLSQNLGGVSHFVSDLGVVIKDGINKYGIDGFKRGDVIITNHQRVAGQHLNNVVVYTPLFFGDELFAFPVIRAHWVDIGGTSTGFGGGDALDPWMEGLQIDQMKIYEGGRLDEKLWQLLKDNIRYPEASLGDLRSQLAACRLAERRLDELLKRYGRDTIVEAIKQIFDESEARCRVVVEGITDGVYEAESWFGGHPIDGGEPVFIKAQVTVKGSDMTIDLTQCSRQVRGALNSRTLAGAMVAYKAITTPLEPVNEGSFRALTVLIQEGNFMMASYPAPMANWSQAIPTVVDTILRALAPAMPEKIPAEHLGVLGGPVVFAGTNNTGEGFVVQDIEGGGWGGRPWEDGESGSVSVCQGDVRNAPIEKMELKWPVMVISRELRQDSGGPGRFRGGLGLVTRVKNLVDGYWNIRADNGRRNYPPCGLWGGKPGAPSDGLLRIPGETEFKRVDVVRHRVPANSEAVFATAGGGGWGDPLERDPELVRKDTIEGFISSEATCEQYGVVLYPDTLEVDLEGTAQLRAKLRQQRAGMVQ